MGERGGGGWVTGMNGLVMEIRSSGDGAVAVFRVTGEIDCDTGEALRARVVEATRRGCRAVVDLSGVTFLDSAGISQLLLTHRALNERSSTMALVGATGMVREVLAITRLDTVFEMVAGPAEVPAPAQ